MIRVALWLFAFVCGVAVAEDRIYLMVSDSMPKEMLLSYGRQAARSGAVLAFRGMDPDHDLVWFFREVLKPLSETGAAMVIDPRVFQSYGVTAVPTFVLAREAPCATMEERRTQNGSPWHACARASDQDYRKLSGAVSLDYALRRLRGEE